MKIEHLALNVADPAAIKTWYQQHLGMQVVREVGDESQTIFLGDDSGQVMLEIYRNKAAMVPDYNAMDPLILHIAFVSHDPERDKERMLHAGASYVTEVRTGDGSHLVMMRDPWGLALQFCRRGVPMLNKS
jgi:catechol 2,3-dioxygenase-like lactoylglutathione lyase family enzyme